MQESIRPKKCIVIMLIILIFFELQVFPIAMCKTDKNTALSGMIHSNLPMDTTRTLYTPFQNNIRELTNKSQLMNYTDYLLKNKQEIDNLRNQKIYNLFQYLIDDNRVIRNITYVPDDYSTIQSAVENASAYDEIIVRNGTYIDYITIYKPLFIHSQYGLYNCIVKPKIEDKPVFDIFSDYVTLSGFNIYNNENERYIGIALNYAEYCVIANNYLHNLNYEIWLHYCNHTILDNNILGVFGQVQYDGIRIENSINITVTNNIWYDHIWEGLFLIHTRNSTVKNNFIEGNYGMVCCDYSDNNTIINNTFSGCFWMNYGSDLCKNNKIVNNTFYKPVADGIYIQYCYNHSILNNTFFDNGIFIFKAYNNRIEDNIVNGKQLMYLENEEDIILTGNYGQILLVNCSDITSEQPQDLSHTVVGIELINTKNSTISNCTIYDNNWEGIYGNNASGNTLFNITTSSNWDEILFRYCNNNNISDSRLFQSAENLIILDTCHNNIFYNNIFGASNADGVRIITSNNNTFTYNEFYGFDLLAALLIAYSSSNVITYNTIRNCARAIMISCSDENKIFYNQIIDNMFGVLCLSSYDLTSDNNTIKFNNIINSQCGFEYFSLKQLKFSNRWSRNYWGEIRILPKPILGFFYGPIGVLTIPLYQFDWNPKKIPNKILDSEEKYFHIK